MSWLYLILVAISIGLLLYWLLVTTEGTYLGARIVALLYNGFAHRYDRVKEFDPQFERFFLSRPMLASLQGRPEPLVLDVATGTGRVPVLLLREKSFTGRVVGLDYARKMLVSAAQKTASYAGRVVYVWQNAMQLPFPDASFDLVICLEALEFMPSPHQVLQEMMRVARPGAQLFLTRRRGWEGKLMPGKTWSRQEMAGLLESIELVDVQISPWQVDYDLVWGSKPGISTAGSSLKAGNLLQLCRCPSCNQPLDSHLTNLICANCDVYYSVARDGIIELARRGARQR